VKLSGSNTEVSREDELLQCCARVAPAPRVLERIAQLASQPLDWQLVLDRSWWHRIRPVTWLHLSALPSGVVPAAFLKILGEQASELRQRSHRLADAQLQAAGLFEDAAVPMLVFKGPSLAKDAYGDLGLRECGDLDMLIRQQDFPRVRQMLVDNGFDCLWDEFGKERKRQLFACEFRRDGVELDVHWDLAPGWLNYRIDFDDLWQGGLPLATDFHHTRKLRPEDSVNVLCMHGTRHWWERLRWICDIAELLNRQLITDWQRVEATAAATRCHRSLWLGIWLASDLLDARLPEEVRHRLEQSKVYKRLGSQVAEWLENAEAAAGSRKLPDRFLFRMRLCERGRDRFSQLVWYLVSKPARSLNWNP
jgi:hypothetical protein